MTHPLLIIPILLTLTMCLVAWRLWPLWKQEPTESGQVFMWIITRWFAFASTIGLITTTGIFVNLNFLAK